MLLPTASLFFALVLAVHSLHAQEEARVSAQGGVVTIVARNVPHRIVLPPSVRVDMDTVEILDAQDVGAYKYLLLTVNGPSTRNGRGVGQCGAGLETGIVWLQLRNWRVVRSQSQLVESCWENAIITETIAWSGAQMQLAYLDLAAGSKSRVLRYDRNQPERGFAVSPVPNSRYRSESAESTTVDRSRIITAVVRTGTGASVSRGSAMPLALIGANRVQYHVTRSGSCRVNSAWPATSNFDLRPHTRTA